MVILTPMYYITILNISNLRQCLISRRFKTSGFKCRMVVLQALVRWTISPHHGDVSTIGHSFLSWVGLPVCKDPVGALLCWGFAYLLASPLLVGLVFVGLGIAGAVINGSPALRQVVAGPILCVVGVITCCMIPWRTCSDHCEDCFEEFEPDPFP